MFEFRISFSFKTVSLFNQRHLPPKFFLPNASAKARKVMGRHPLKQSLLVAPSCNSLLWIFPLSAWPIKNVVAAFPPSASSLIIVSSQRSLPNAIPPCYIIRNGNWTARMTPTTNRAFEPETKAKRGTLRQGLIFAGFNDERTSSVSFFSPINSKIFANFKNNIRHLTLVVH